MARGGAAAIRRRLTGAADEVLVDEGPVELVRVDGAFLLRQGDVAVDVSRILLQENYQTARVVLNLRRGPAGGPLTLVRAEPATEAAPAAVGGA